ncbi:acetate--CoA ligase family protein [Saccharopolyspora shandongensis]|uniref:acetate--CoA ligase family protein n=1 Tax=Saccharopolyspora shandongensis TaxID=418495 RepID=UPI0033F512F3
MPRTDLDPLFAPGRIGIAGLSNREDTWGRMVLRNLREGGFAGEIVAIAPRSATDIPSVADLAELDEPLDLLLIALPAAAVPGVVSRARQTGKARSVLVFSAGFSESGPAGAELERQLVAAADGIPLVGPNCVGLLSRPGDAVATVSAYVAREHPPAGPVAIVSQSGALGFVMATLLERHGVAISSYVSVGNEACLGIGEIGAHLVERPDVVTVGLYVESVRDPAALRALGARAAELGKRVVALKAGTSAAGQRATLSHTAAVAGDALLFRGLCDDAGIITAESDEAFADLLHAAQSDARLPPRPRLAIITMTGGGGAILADRLSAHGVAVPQLSPRTRERIDALGLTSIASSANPIDLGGGFTRDAARFGDLFALLDDDPDVDGIVGMFTFGDRNRDWYRELAEDLAKLRTPAWMIWAAGTAADRAGTPPGTVFDTIESFVRGLPAVRATGGDEPADRTAAPAAAVRAVREPVWAGPGDRVLSEADAKDVVRALGVAYAPTAVAAGESEVDDLVTGLPASPGYVVKVDSPEVAHRAKLGLVRLGVPAGEVPEAARSLFAAARGHGVTRCRVLVQPQLEHRGEIVVGGIRDPQYGPALLVGAGGARVEAADAQRYGVPVPARAETLARAAAEVAARYGPLDTDALTALLLATGRLLVSCPEITELDINPLLIRPDGELVAVDALIVREAPTGVRNGQ